MLARHPGVDTVAFSGPTTQGRRIAAICGAELKPASLELGGQAAAIVLDDADLDKTAADLGLPVLRQLRADVLRDVPGAGARAAPRRVRRRAGRARLEVRARRPARGGHHDGPAGLRAPPLRRGGPGPRERHRRGAGRFRRQAPRLPGARLLLRADRADRRHRGDADRPGRDLRPGRDRLSYRDEAEAIAFANNGFGLAATVWTGDPQRGLDIARRARVGTFGINLYVPDIGSPWGGRGVSGQGVAYGPEGMDSYLTTKSVFLPAAR